MPKTDRTANGQHPSDPTAPQEPVAVIGAALRLPAGVDSPSSLWEALLEQRDLIGECDPKGRRNAARAHLDLVDLDHFGGYLTDVEGFQPEFFGISPREATGLDPQHRLIVEVAWEALEHAGIAPRSLAGSRTGVYAGQSLMGYLHRIPADDREVYHETGAVLSGIAGRLSHVLGLRGPSVAVDGACASSLIAVHLACRSLAYGESDIALAGGANIGIDSGGDVSFARAGMLSKTGRCHAFDAAADGFVRSEGSGVVVLKRLSDARRDGDRIMAVVRGSAINHVGRSQSIMRPDADAQAEVIATALQRSGVAADTVGLVEAHGTGTPTGDPIEYTSISSAYGHGDHDCAIGSVKTNIGHAESAAGIMGFIKAVLSVQQGTLPANLHFHRWNPEIDTTRARLVVPTESGPWPVPGRRRAAVSSFGVTGMNAHIIIEETDPAPEPAPVRPHPGPATIVLTHASAGGLAATAGRLAEHLEQDRAPAPLADIAHTLAATRSGEPQRVAFPAEDHEALLIALKELSTASGTLSTAPVTESVDAREEPVWVFSGHGSQWAGMGRTLLATEPAFAAAIDRLEPIAEREQGMSLRALISEGAEATRIDHVQPLVFAMQVALAQVWRARGVRPGAVVGHSMGEVAAAVVAGILTEEQGMQIICRRTRLMLSVAGGTMATVTLGSEEVRAVIDEQGCAHVTPAVLLSPEATVIAGDADEVARLQTYWEGQGVRVTQVPVEVASHSPQVDPILTDITTELAHLTPATGTVPFFSTVTDDPRVPGTLDGAYWAENLRRPVRFHHAAQALLEDGYRVFLEISPHPLLTGAVQACAEAAGRRVAAVPTLLRERDDAVSLATHLGALFCSGARIDVDAAFPGNHTELPATTWDRRPFWAEAAPQDVGSHPLLGSHAVVPDDTAPGGIRHGWSADLGTKSHPWLADHRVRESAVLPGTAYVEMALAAAGDLIGGPVELTEIEFDRILLLQESTEVHTVAAEPERGVVEVEVMSRETDADWTVHARARLRPAPADPQSPPAMALPPADATAFQPTDQHYAMLRGLGLDYGPAFRGLAEIAPGPTGTLARLELPQSAEIRRTHMLHLHPVELDNCLQALTTGLADLGGDASPWVPTRIGGLRFSPGPQSIRWCRATVLESTDTEILGRIDCYDDAGNPIGAISDVRLVPLAPKSAAERVSDRLHEIAWTPAPLPEDTDAAGRRYLLVTQPGDESGAADLADHLTGSGAHATVTALAPTTPTAWAEQVVQAVAASGGPYQGLVLHLAPQDPADAPDPLRGLDQLTMVSELVRALTAAAPPALPRLWILTRDAHPAAGPAAPGHYALRGLVRALAAEHPELHTTLVDAGGSTTAVELAAELTAGTDEDEVAWQDGTRHVARLRRAPLRSAEPPRDLHQVRRWEQDGFVAMPDPAGTLAGIRLVDLPRRDPREGQVEIRVNYAALNFRDTMNALGILPSDDGAAIPMGGDILGTVTAAGPDVTHVAPGQRVIACSAEGGFGSFVTANAAMVCAVPPELSDEQAATCGYAYLTAYEALIGRAGLSSGETVLIHSAASGTGLAAVAIAHNTKATVIATAGSPEKRDYLRELGVEHVFDSRSLDFADEIDALTGGRGVDVVLNSLAGPAMQASLGLVAPFGRFIELGKRDLYSDTRVGLRTLRHNATYSAFDIIAFIDHHPEKVGRTQQELLTAMAQGRIAPLPHRVFDFADLDEALRTMAEGHHRGRLLLRMPEAGEVTVDSAPGSSRIVRPQGSYLITGGTSGIGLQAAQWLTDHGADRIVLNSRSAPGDEAQQVLAGLRSRGTDVRVVRGDIADAATAAAMVAAGTEDGRSVRGVMHCAGVLDDAPVHALDPDHMAATWRPKVEGAMHLHTAASGQPLDWFVLCSSWAATIGNPSQANYAAANAWLDAFAHWRRGHGLPALSIGWGVWAETGMATHLAGRVSALGTAEGIAALDALIPRERAHAVVSALDLDVWFAGFEHAAQKPFFASVTERRAHSADSDGALARIMACAPGPQRRALLVEHVRSIVAAVMKGNSDIRAEAEFTDLGVDSLMAVELRNRVRADLDIALGVNTIWSNSSCERLAAHLEPLLSE